MRKRPRYYQAKAEAPPARKVGNVRKKAPDKVRLADTVRTSAAHEAPQQLAPRTVPALDHVPEDVRKQRCCKTCYTYGDIYTNRALARHGRISVSAQAPQQLALPGSCARSRPGRRSKTALLQNVLYTGDIYTNRVFARPERGKCRKTGTQQLAPHARFLRSITSRKTFENSVVAKRVIHTGDIYTNRASLPDTVRTSAEAPQQLALPKGFLRPITSGQHLRTTLLRSVL